MSTYLSTTDFPSIARRLRAASHIAVVSHAKPDGDAAGSILAITRALRSMGKRVDGIFTGVVESLQIRGQHQLVVAYSDKAK